MSLPDASQPPTVQTRGDLSTRYIRVAVAIIRAPQPRHDPIVFFQGGPDFPGIAQFTADYFRGKEYARHRDVIMFDARGIGSSRPYLGCPELDELRTDLYPDDPSAGRLALASRACRQRLVAEGVDPRAYGAADVALDVEALRHALGIDRWNVVAVSAGGPAALEYMRLDAVAIRSVVLDSAMTRAWEPSVGLMSARNRLMERAFQPVHPTASLRRGVSRPQIPVLCRGPPPRPPSHRGQRRLRGRHREVDHQRPLPA